MVYGSLLLLSLAVGASLVSSIYVRKLFQDRYLDVEVYQSWSVGWATLAIVFSLFFLMISDTIGHHPISATIQILQVVVMIQFAEIGVYGRIAYLIEKDGEDISDKGKYIKIYKSVESVSRLLIILSCAFFPATMDHSVWVENSSSSFIIDAIHTGFYSANLYVVICLVIFSFVLVFATPPYAKEMNPKFKMFVFMRIGGIAYLLGEISELLGIILGYKHDILFLNAWIGSAIGVFSILIGALKTKDLHLREKLLKITIEENKNKGDS